MITLFILIAVFAVCCVGFYFNKDNGRFDSTRESWIIRTMISGALLVMYVLLGAIVHFEEEVNIKQFESVKETVERARENGTNVESAALQVKIADTNQWLAKVRYWNDTDFAMWLPDEVDKLEPIE